MKWAGSKPDERDHRGRLILLLLLLIAVAVRIPRLSEGLWYDEIAAWRDYSMHGAWISLTTYFDPANHILQSALSAWAVPALGNVIGEEPAMRLPSLVASLLLVPLLLIGLRRYAPRHVPDLPIVCAVLAAVMPVAILAGTEARGYPFMILCAAATSLVMHRLMETRRMHLAALYAVLMALGIWAHLITVFVAFGHAAVLIGFAAHARSWRAAIPGAAALIGAALLTLLALSPVLSKMVAMRQSIRAADDAQPSLFGSEGVLAMLQLGGAWHLIGALAALPALITGAVVVRRDPALRTLALLLFTGLPIAVLCALVLDTWIYARFLLFGVAGSILLIGTGIAWTWQRDRRIGVALIALLLSGWFADLLTRPVRQPVREAAAYVRALRAPDERVLSIDLRHQLLDVYGADLQPAYSLLHGADLADQLAAVRPAWVIMLYPRRVDEERRALLRSAGLSHDTTLPGWIDSGGGAIEIWRTSEPAPRSVNRDEVPRSDLSDSP